jgi:predicted PurR-regulated permease PerM
VWILAATAILFFLRFSRELLIPIAVAVLVSYALWPVVEWLQRRRIPRSAGAAIVMLVILGCVAWGMHALKDDVSRSVEAVPGAVERARTLVLSKLGWDLPSAGQLTRPVGTSGQDGPRAESTASSNPWPVSLVGQVGTSILEVAGNVVVVFFLVFFFLIFGADVRKRLVEIAGPDPERRRLTATIIDDINAQVGRYLLVLLLTAVIVGVATWAVLAWMGVEHAAMWGMLAGVFNSIPYFGPVVVSGGLFVVGLVQGGGISQALQMAGAAIVITSLEGWLLAPPLLGKAERMSPLAVFLGLLLWTWLWGPWGTILAVPMLAVVKSVADHVPGFKPFGRLLAP